MLNKVRAQDSTKHEWCCALLSQLARIQTDSVADTLKERYPDIHLEIGENLHKHDPKNISKIVHCDWFNCLW